MNKEIVDKLSKKVDEICDRKDKNEILKVIDELEENVDSLADLNIKMNVYYILGNCYKELHDIKIDKDASTTWEYEHKELFKSIFYYRKSIIEDTFKDLSIQLKVGLMTNLGNLFSHYGRPIEALKYFDDALSEHKKEQLFKKKKNILYPNYFMALANKGICLEHYSHILYDYSHADLFNKESYKLFKKAISKIKQYQSKSRFDFNFYDVLKNSLENKCIKLNNFYDSKFLEQSENYNDYELSKNEKEKEYKKWILSNKLYLNPMNDLGCFNIVSHDILGLPSLTTPIDNGFPIYITYFNQIKQEFIFNRSLLFEGVHNITTDFYDNDTNIINDFDYNLYTMDIEKIKIVFRGFYGLFDKIAFLLNKYFELGRRDDDPSLNFNTIWKNKNNSKSLNPKLLQLENFAIRGLYLLNRDINFSKNEENEFNMSLEPHSGNVSKIRNHLEHKFLMVKVLKPLELNDRERKYYQITEDELTKETIRLGQLSREAIIYTSLAIFLEEEKKNNKEGTYSKQQLDLY